MLQSHWLLQAQEFYPPYKYRSLDMKTYHFTKTTKTYQYQLTAFLTMLLNFLEHFIFLFLQWGILFPSFLYLFLQFISFLFLLNKLMPQFFIFLKENSNDDGDWEMLVIATRKHLFTLTAHGFFFSNTLICAKCFSLS